MLAEKTQALFVYGIEVTDAPESIGKFFGCFATPEDDRLIAAHAGNLVDPAVGAFAIFEIALGAND